MYLGAFENHRRIKNSNKKQKTKKGKNKKNVSQWLIVRSNVRPLGF
jgi:hypothetical protein